jgi:hypothetical protein
MKLGSASKHITAACRGGDSRSIDDRNVALGCGISHQTRDSKTHYNKNYGTSTEWPLRMDEDGPPHQGYAYKGKAPWSAPPVKDSDPAVFHAMSSDNAAPQIHQFAGTINLGFSIVEDKRSDINVSLLLKSFMAFAKQTDGDSFIDPLNGSTHCITNPSNIPTTKEGVGL